jgi:flagellar biosynthesis protein FliQ
MYLDGREYHQLHVQALTPLLAIPEAKRRREEAAAAPRGSSRAGLMAGKRTVLALFIWAMAMVIFMATLHTQGEDVNLVYIYRHVHILINQFVLLQYMQGRIK